MVHAFTQENLLVRVGGDTLALMPPLIISEAEIAEIFARVKRAIEAVP
jgi:beta-alanine--pyruvate transaminase